LLQPAANLRADLVRAKDVVRGQEAAAADAVFGIVRTGEDAGDQLHPRPDTARVLPAAARATEPLAENGAGGDQAPLVLLEAAVDRRRLPGGAHTDGDQAGQQVGGNSEAGALGNRVDLADQLDPVAGADQP